MKDSVAAYCDICWERLPLHECRGFPVRKKDPRGKDPIAEEDSTCDNCGGSGLKPSWQDGEAPYCRVCTGLGRVADPGKSKKRGPPTSLEDGIRCGRCDGTGRDMSIFAVRAGDTLCGLCRGTGRVVPGHGVGTRSAAAEQRVWELYCHIVAQNPSLSASSALNIARKRIDDYYRLDASEGVD